MQDIAIKQDFSAFLQKAVTTRRLQKPFTKKNYYKTAGI